MLTVYGYETADLILDAVVAMLVAVTAVLRGYRSRLNNQAPTSSGSDNSGAPDAQPGNNSSRIAPSNAVTRNTAGKSITNMPSDESPSMRNTIGCL